MPGLKLIHVIKRAQEHKTIELLLLDLFNSSPSGPRLNIKTVLSTYGDFHVKDKTAVRTSYL